MSVAGDCLGRARRSSTPDRPARCHVSNELKSRCVEDSLPDQSHRGVRSLRPTQALPNGVSNQVYHMHLNPYILIYNITPLLAVETVRLHVTTAPISLDVDAGKLPGRRDRAVSDENVVRLGLGQYIAVNVVHEDVGNVDAVGRLSCRSAIH